MPEGENEADPEQVASDDNNDEPKVEEEDMMIESTGMQRCTDMATPVDSFNSSLPTSLGQKI